MSLNGGAKPKPVFPNVRCGVGHPDEPGYVICTHVIQGEKAKVVHPPMIDRLGEVLCSEERKHLRSELKLCCATCARFRKFINV